MELFRRDTTLGNSLTLPQLEACCRACKQITCAEHRIRIRTLVSTSTSTLRTNSVHHMKKIGLRCLLQLRSCLDTAERPNLGLLRASAEHLQYCYNRIDSFVHRFADRQGCSSTNVALAHSMLAGTTVKVSWFRASRGCGALVLIELNNSK